MPNQSSAPRLVISTGDFGELREYRHGLNVCVVVRIGIMKAKREKEFRVICG